MNSTISCSIVWTAMLERKLFKWDIIVNSCWWCNTDDVMWVSTFDDCVWMTEVPLHRISWTLITHPHRNYTHYPFACLSFLQPTHQWVLFTISSLFSSPFPLSPLPPLPSLSLLSSPFPLSPLLSSSLFFSPLFSFPSSPFPTHLSTLPSLPPSSPLLPPTCVTWSNCVSNICCLVASRSWKCLRMAGMRSSMAWRHRDTSAKEWEPSMPYYTIGIYRVCIFSYVLRTRGNWRWLAN